MHCYKLCQKPAVLFCCLYFCAISAGQKIQKKTCSNLSAQKSFSFSYPQKEERAEVDNENKNDTAEDGNGDVNPDTFSVFKYFGYGVDVTRHSLASSDPTRNFTTNLLEPLFRFRPSKNQSNIWRNLTLPDIIWDTGIFETNIETQRSRVEAYILDSWIDYMKGSGIAWLSYHEEVYRRFPANFSSLYLTANQQEKVVAQTLVLFFYFDTFVKRDDVSLLSESLVKAATTLAHLHFNGTTRPLFYAFFRRFGTHYHYQLHFGRLTHIRTLLEIDFYRKVGETKVENILKKYAMNATDDTIPPEFYNRSRSVVSHFGRGDGVGDHFRSFVPVSAVVLPIHDLLQGTKVIPNTEAMELALKTYLFEYELRSIRDVLTAFNGDFRSELCFQKRPKAGDNLRLTEEYLAMKPFPDRGSLWDNSTEPGGYRNSVEWHLSECIPAYRDPNNFSPDTFSVFKYFAYGLDVTRHSLTSDDPKRNFTTNLLEPLFRFRPGTRSYRNVTLPDYIFEDVEDGNPTLPRITILDTWWKNSPGTLELLYDHKDTSLKYPSNFSQMYLLANFHGMVAIQTLKMSSTFVTVVNNRNVKLLAKNFTAVATSLAHLAFNATTRPLFYDFFSRFGTHYNLYISFGKLTRVITLLDVDYFKAKDYIELKVILDYNAQNLSVPEEFSRFSRSKWSNFGYGEDDQNCDSTVPVQTISKPIHDLLERTGIISGDEEEKVWKIALETYLFEYELRSIRDVLTTFKGDNRSELCAKEDKTRGVGNLLRTEEYLTMKPFPNRSIPEYYKVPGGYQDRIEWHLGVCIPSHRYLFNRKNVSPDTFFALKYFGYGVELTRHSLASDDPTRNFTTNLLNPLFRFRPGNFSWDNVTLPDYLAELDDRSGSSAAAYYLDSWRETEKPHPLSLLSDHVGTYQLWPSNFSKTYLKANRQGLVLAQVLFPLYFFSFTVQTNYVSLLSKNFREEATSLAYNSFDASTRQQFYAFFRRFGTHFNYKISFGRLTRFTTLLEIDFYKKNKGSNLDLMLINQKKSNGASKEFYDYSSTVVSQFGGGKVGDSVLTLIQHTVPVKVTLKPIYSLLKSTGIIFTEEHEVNWNLALETYLFEYELRSIRDVLTAFDGDSRSELCSMTDLHQRGVNNLRFTEQYLAMTPFPNRSLPLYSKVPGGYRDRIEWHLGDCIPSNRDMYPGSANQTKEM